MEEKLSPLEKLKEDINRGDIIRVVFENGGDYVSHAYPSSREEEEHLVYLKQFTLPEDDRGYSGLVCQTVVSATIDLEKGTLVGVPIEGYEVLKRNIETATKSESSK